MDRLVVLALCIGDVDCLVLAYEHTGISYLSTHLAIERSIVENELII